MKVSNQCINLVAKWEGFRANAYLCPANIWTIGYGTTKWPNGQAVKNGDTITKEKALELLKVQVDQHAATINQYVKVPLSQNQYDALASFQYNLGRHILKGSALLTYLNAKQWDKAANSMLQYNKARVNGVLQPLKGLTNRRKEEVALFKEHATAIKVDASKLQEDIVSGAKAFRVQSGPYQSREACIAAMNEAHQKKYFAYVELAPGSSKENGWRYTSGKYTNVNAARQAATRALLDNKINFASVLGRLQ